MPNENIIDDSKNSKLQVLITRQLEAYYNCGLTFSALHQLDILPNCFIYILYDQSRQGNEKTECVRAILLSESVAFNNLNQALSTLKFSRIQPTIKPCPVESLWPLILFRTNLYNYLGFGSAPLRSAPSPPCLGTHCGPPLVVMFDVCANRRYQLSICFPKPKPNEAPAREQRGDIQRCSRFDWSYLCQVNSPVLRADKHICLSTEPSKPT